MGQTGFCLVLVLLAASLTQAYIVPSTIDEIREAFREEDKDGNGFITADELPSFMTDEQVEEMIQEADIDGDRQVNYEEFVTAMRKTHAKMQKLECSDNLHCPSQMPVCNFDYGAKGFCEPCPGHCVKTGYHNTRAIGICCDVCPGQTVADGGGCIKGGYIREGPSTTDEIEEAFREEDKDGNGFITAAELQDTSMTDEQVEEMIQKADIDGDRQVNYEEFVTAMKKTNEMIKMFGEADKDGNGFISAAEVRHEMANHGKTLTDAEVDEHIREADMDGDGRVNPNEFFKMILDGDKK